MAVSIVSVRVEEMSVTGEPALVDSSVHILL